MNKKKIFVCIFLGLIFSVCLLDMMKNDKEFSSLENRYLKKKPKFKISKFLDGSYNKEIDEYVNDQFIGRDNFINLKSIGEEILGKVENNNIVYGKENYMFYKTEDLDEKQIEKNLGAIKKFIDKSNLNSKVMLVPYSSTIYKEYVPKGLNLIDEEKIINESTKELTNENTINVLESLRRNKDKDIYYKSDHHWTTYGSYLGYLEYCKVKKLEPIELESLKEKEVDGFLGTYYRRAKKFNTKKEKIKYYEMNNISMEINGVKYNSVYDQLEVNNEDKHSIFLKGNNPLTIIKNKNDKVKGTKLIVLKDSFANSLIPFIANHYEEVHVIDLRHFNRRISEYLNENKFDDSLILYSVNSINKDSNIVKIAY